MPESLKDQCYIALELARNVARKAHRTPNIDLPALQVSARAVVTKLEQLYQKLQDVQEDDAPVPPEVPLLARDVPPLPEDAGE